MGKRYHAKERRERRGSDSTATVLCLDTTGTSSVIQSVLLFVAVQYVISPTVHRSPATYRGRLDAVVDRPKHRRPLDEPHVQQIRRVEQERARRTLRAGPERVAG